LAQLAEQISTEMAENRKKTIAVVEFVDLKGNITDLGRLLSEELITRLFQTKRFTVIERQMLNKVIADCLARNSTLKKVKQLRVH
jgi:curli biogenesis system outer membrane secretion channel CsgG